MPADSPMSHLSPSDADLPEYRAISTLAVAGLVLALVAPLALVSLAWGFLPAAGMAVSAAALWRIRRSESVLLGRGAALVGLLVSTAVMVAAPTRVAVWRQLVLAEARRVADDWFRALGDGRADRAFLWTLDPAARPAFEPGAMAEFFARGPRWREELAAYERPSPAEAPANPVAELLRLGRNVQSRWVETTALGDEREKTVVYLTYRVEPSNEPPTGAPPADAPGKPDGSAGAPARWATPREVLLRLERRQDETGAVGWRLAHVEFVDR